MIKLAQLLSLLERDGVDLVILQEGSKPHIRTAEGLRPVSRQATERADIAQLLETARLEGTLQSLAEGGAKAVSFSLGDAMFEADIVLHKARLQVRFSRGETPDLIALTDSDIPEPRLPGPPPSPAGAGGAQGTLETILVETRRLGASDVHISAGYPPKIRCMGRLTAMGSALSPVQVERMLLSVLSSDQRSTLESVGYTDLALAFPKAGRLRVNISRQRGGLKGCFRLIAETPASLESLGLPPELSRITVHHQGLVVVSGPNGAGKTTTMASLVDLFNETRPIHIITVEDPVEILHRPKKAVISQRQVGLHTRTFDTALKGALREDPDVIAIGELRDLETVEMALSAAETGHLVIATMSTPSGAVTIDRLIDMFPQGVQSQIRNTLAGTLKMVISQRLVPGKDGKTRYVAAELITGSIPLYAMIRDNKLYQLPSLLQQGKAYGMIRIEDSLNALVQKGLVTVETAKLYANDPNAVSGSSGTGDTPREPLPEDKAGRFGLKQMAGKLRR